MSDALRQQIATALAALPPGDHEITLTAQGRPIHLKLRRERRADAVLITFHGATDRKTRPLPIFAGFLPRLVNIAHQVAISDPSMLLHDRINLAWFSGDSAFPSQAILTEVFVGIVDELKVGRTIYLGTSGGGFAGLYYSHCHPGSFVVAGNPQISIETYHHGSVIKRYRMSCWPELSDTNPLTDVTCADLAPLYAKGFDNTVIYVQSMGDRMHFENQMMYFVAGLSQTDKRDRFLLHSDFWGKMGHVPATHDYLRWIQAICTSPTTDIADILAVWHGLEPVAAAPAAGRSQKPDGKTAGFDLVDVTIAERLRALRATQAKA